MLTGSFDQWVLKSCSGFVWAVELVYECAPNGNAKRTCRRFESTLRSYFVREFK